jgi:hypothetical protein
MAGSKKGNAATPASGSGKERKETEVLQKDLEGIAGGGTPDLSDSAADYREMEADGVFRDNRHPSNRDPFQ